MLFPMCFLAGSRAIHSCFAKGALLRAACFGTRRIPTGSWIWLRLGLIEFGSENLNFLFEGPNALFLGQVSIVCTLEIQFQAIDLFSCIRHQCVCLFETAFLALNGLSVSFEITFLALNSLSVAVDEIASSFQGVGLQTWGAASFCCLVLLITSHN